MPPVRGAVEADIYREPSNNGDFIAARAQCHLTYTVFGEKFLPV